MLIGKGHALVPSRSHPGDYHSTDLESQTCTCEDFTITKERCWHLREFEKLQNWCNEIRESNPT